MTGSDLIPPTPTDSDYQASPPADDAALFATQDPIALFGEWLGLAKEREINDANAMALATADDSGMPDVRMVLLKDVSPAGFTFYTNTTSTKGRQLQANPQAALCFHWKSLRRQVRVRGTIAEVSAEEADAYFQSRARDSRIGAWASDQSAPMDGRFVLEKAIAREAARFGLGPVPRPPHWTGYCLTPERIEFWRDRPFRLHDRLVFSRAGGGWATQRLFP
jgi:pyridoxamine 5'-phosphate oxidase